MRSKMRSLYDGEVFDRAKSAGSGYPSARAPIDIRKRALGAAALPDRRTVASHLWLSLGAQGLTAPSRGVFDYELANKEARREDSLLQTELRNTLKTPRSPLYCAPDLRLRSPAVRYENRHNLERCRCPATAYLERANTNSCPSDLLIDSDSMQSSRRDRLWHSAGPEGEISASKDDLNPWHHEGSFGHGALTIMAERRFGESLRVRGGSADLAAQLLTEEEKLLNQREEEEESLRRRNTERLRLDKMQRKREASRRVARTSAHLLQPKHSVDERRGIKVSSKQQAEKLARKVADARANPSAWSARVEGHRRARLGLNGAAARDYVEENRRRLAKGDGGKNETGPWNDRLLLLKLRSLLGEVGLAAARRERQMRLVDFKAETWAQLQSKSRHKEDMPMEATRKKEQAQSDAAARVLLPAVGAAVRIAALIGRIRQACTVAVAVQRDDAAAS